MAGLNGPHLDPTTVTSFMTAGVRSTDPLEAMVDLRTTVPRGTASLMESANPELLPAAHPDRGSDTHPLQHAKAVSVPAKARHVGAREPDQGVVKLLAPVPTGMFYQKTYHTVP